ncbi:MAG: TonB-dependent receptor [Sphingomonadales bacterium]|nr:MAG: TonB-dependent receptor [Sphingomonadales bacterium]TNF01871.1 MAG: TonB-dependent receptor [Sphingomonadales bacterium]
MITRFHRLATVAGTVLAVPLAQAAEPPPGPAITPAADTDSAAPLPDGGAGAIFVTARRRSESAQDVPLSISVVDAATIGNTGSFNVSRLQQLQPTLQFYSSNPRNSAINIRGIGAPFGLTNDGIEQGVGIYVDQVYYNRVAAATLDFVDIDQIEVLRGPQGTLYGKNTTAGAINITTRPPSFDFEGRAEISLGNLGFKQAKASVSGPLSDEVAVRIGLSTTDRRGTIHNVATNQWVNGLDTIGLRGALLWKATDRLSFTLSGDYNLQDAPCCAQIYARVGTTQRPLARQYAALAAAFGYAPPSTNAFDRVTDLDADLRARNELGGVSLRAEWDVGAGSFTSVSAYRYWDWQPSNDRDFTGLPVTVKSQNPTQQKQWTQEFRYAQEGKHFDFVIGAFGFYQEIRTSGSQVQGSAASRWLINPNNPLSADPTVLDGLTAINDIRLDNTSLALFGQLGWKVTDRLQIQPGIRLNYDKKKGLYSSVVTNGDGQSVTYAGSQTDSRIAAQYAVLAPQYFEPRFSDWNLSYDLTLSYDLAPDIMAYATYARSFKSGGVNLNGVPSDTSGNPILAAGTVKPEKVDHFEIGLKSQFWDRRATLNLSGFWTEIRDFQANVTNGQLGVLRGYLANADKVRVRGIEADFNVRPSDRFTAYANGAFTDHEYVKFTDAPCPPELAGGTTAGAGQSPSAPGTPGGISPANCDISGQWLPGISRWAFSFGAEYNHPVNLLGREGEMYLGYDGSYRSRFSSNASRSAYTDIEGYALSNVRFGFRTGEGFNLYGWVRNLFDKYYFEQLAVTSGNTGLISGQPGDPRTYGLTIATRF